MPASAVSIGVFDGVHSGHRALLAQLRAVAAKEALRAVVVTFDPHPASVLRPDAAPKLLVTVDRRIRLLRETGVDDVDVLSFTSDVAALSPEAFVDEVLVGRLDARHVVVGENFRFGRQAAGTIDTLRRLGLVVEAEPLVHVGGASGDTVSSTWIRERVAVGDVAAAARGLMRPHLIEGPVVRGEARGRRLGYPTANIGFDAGVAVPADGVYAGRLVRPDGTSAPAAVSVGTNPTFEGRERTVEAFAIDARPDLDLYDEHVVVEFVERLRGQVRFDSVETLVEQMSRDVDQSRAVLGYT